MPFQNLAEEVLDPRLCTACGVCEPACPKSYIRFNGIDVVTTLHPDELNCGDCCDCLKVCPGSDPETAIGEQDLFGRSRTAEERWLGIFENVMGGRSMDIHVFNRSASGGSTTSLLSAAREMLGLDMILAMGRDDAHPWKASPRMIHHPEDMVASCQSTYQLTPYLSILRSVYRNHYTKKIGVVGVACHVQAIRKLQRLDSHVGEWAREKIGFVIEIACSSSTRVEGTESLICELLQLRLEDVRELRFREGDYPGQIMVQTKTGEKHYLPFWKAVQHFKENKTHRCLSCGDWLSGLADISISDGDPNIFKASLGESNIEKHGRIFVRTTLGNRVLAYAQQEKFLEAWPIELVGQNLGLDRKRNRRATYEEMNVPIPKGPVSNYKDEMEIIDDARFLEVKKING